MIQHKRAALRPREPRQKPRSPRAAADCDEAGCGYTPSTAATRRASATGHREKTRKEEKRGGKKRKTQGRGVHHGGRAHRGHLTHDTYPPKHSFLAKSSHFLRDPTPQGRSPAARAEPKAQIASGGDGLRRGGQRRNPRLDAKFLASLTHEKPTATHEHFLQSQAKQSVYRRV